MNQILAKALLAFGLTLIVSSCANKLSYAPELQDTFQTFDQAQEIYSENRDNKPLVSKELSKLINQKEFNIHVYQINTLAGKLLFEGKVMAETIRLGEVNSYYITCQIDRNNDIYKQAIENPNSYKTNANYTIKGNYDYLVHSWGNQADSYRFYIKDCNIKVLK
ncbi:hypothetical protein [Pleionea sediminis]|uniref:hypothetical protein n=1 Tax=Pleionea sediminis TaxID=2569479 RepID=UPI001186A3BC|nr:hypothetical protein [Pleionea sediminis]